MESIPKIYVIIVNWNGWRDTIECLESLFRLEYSRFRVIVCDNDSEDDSVRHIINWCQGGLEPALSSISTMADLTNPPVTKPVSYKLYDRLKAELGGLQADDPSLAIVNCGQNLGFAGGCNVAMRYAMAKEDADFVWLLNNDTVVEPHALSELVSRCQADAAIGICGSTLRYYTEPEIIQAQGGVCYNRWTGIARNLGYQLHLTQALPEKYVTDRLDYVHGASMLVSIPFLRDIGLMNETYFLYFEELDWAVRSSARYKLAYAGNSVVYHKEGASIGCKSSPEPVKQFRSEYYLVQSKLQFTRNFFPLALPGIYLGFLCTIIVRLCRGQFSRAALIIKALCTSRVFIQS